MTAGRAKAGYTPQWLSLVGTVQTLGTRPSSYNAFSTVAGKVGKGRRHPQVPSVNVPYIAAPKTDIAVSPVP